MTVSMAFWKKKKFVAPLPDDDSSSTLQVTGSHTCTANTDFAGSYSTTGDYGIKTFSDPSDANVESVRGLLIAVVICCNQGLPYPECHLALYPAFSDTQCVLLACGRIVTSISIAPFHSSR